MFVHYHMTMSPTTIRPDQTVAEAMELLQTNRFRHLPVVNEEGVLVGIVSDRDLRSARPSSVAHSKERQNVEERVRNTPISILMSRDCLFLERFATLDDALLIFQSRKIGALPVVDEDHRLIGIFSISDLLKAYRCLFGLGEKGSMLISIEDDGDPRALSRLVNILEEKEIPFTRLVRTDGSCDSMRMIYIRINTYNVRSVHKALEAEGFVIHVPQTSL